MKRVSRTYNITLSRLYPVEINYSFYMKLVAGSFYMTKVTNRSKYHLHMKTLYDDKTEEEFNEQKHFIFVQSERDIFNKIEDVLEKEVIERKHVLSETIDEMKEDVIKLMDERIRKTNLKKAEKWNKANKDKVKSNRSNYYKKTGK